MKRLLFGVLALACAAFIILSGCTLFGGGNADSTAQVVGHEGGEFGSDSGECKVIVPQGALENKTEVSISQYTDEKPFGDDQASTFFEISGLNEIRLPVTIQLKTNKPLSGETYVALGTPSYVKSLNEEITGFTYLPCDIKDDTVEFILEPFEEAGENPENAAEISFLDKLIQPKAAYAQDSGQVFLSAAVITNQKTSRLKNGKFKIISGTNIPYTQVDMKCQGKQI